MKIFFERPKGEKIGRILREAGCRDFSTVRLPGHDGQNMGLWPGRETDNMSDLRLVAYCGVYCGICAQCCRIPQAAQSLQQAMRLEGYEYWGKEFPGFETFWKFLDSLAQSESRCSCRSASCGPPFCGIRKCARARGIEVCVFCHDYPCPYIRKVAERYPTLLSDGLRMKSIGIEAWIREQEERRSSGFAYADIRYPFEESWVPGREAAEDKNPSRKRRRALREKSR